MIPSKYLYLCLMIAGLILPLYHAFSWVNANGWEPLGYIDAMLVNQAARSVASSMLLINTTLIVFMLSECRARRDRLSLIAVPVMFLLGPAVGVPLYFILRLRPRAKRT